MSTIFASDFALKGIAPNTGRWTALDLKPRASVPAIGADLHNADTMTFQRIRDVQDGAGRCDIPWCVDDFLPREDVDAEYARSAGDVHMHYGVTKRVGLHSYERNHEDPVAHDHQSTAEVRIMRFDDDDPITPTVGQAQVYVEGIGSDPIHPTDLLRLTRVIEGQAHVALEATGREQVGRHAVAVPEHTGTCYLPWCTDCEVYDGHNLEGGDYGRCHTGARVEVEVRGTFLNARNTIKIELEKSDWDADSIDPPTTGETFIYMSTGMDGAYDDGESMTPDQAEEVGLHLINRARLARAHSALRNPNRVTPEQIASAGDGR